MKRRTVNGSMLFCLFIVVATHHLSHLQAAAAETACDASNMMIRADDPSFSSLQEAFDAAAQKTLVLNGKKAYQVDRLVLQRPVNVVTNGCLFVRKSSGPSFTIVVASPNVTFDRINLSLAEGVAARGVALDRAHGFRCAEIRVIAETQVSGESGYDNAVRISDTDDARLGFVECQRFSCPVIVERSQHIHIGGFRISHYVRGAYYRDCLHCYAGSSRVFHASPDADVQAGHNALLLESKSEGAQANLVFEDWEVSDAGEHGIRLGGQYAMRNIKLVRPVIHDCGASGIKILCGSSYHEDCLLDSPQIWNVGVGERNHSGILVQNTIRTVVKQPHVFARNGEENSAYHGIRLTNVKACSILDPHIESTRSDGILIDRSLPNGGLVRNESIVIRGGFVSSCGGNGIHIDCRGTAVEGIRIAGFPLVKDCGRYGVCVTSDEESAVLGSSITADLRLCSTGHTVRVGGDFLCDLRGVFRDEIAQLSPANGSILLVRPEGELYVRREAKWMQVEAQDLALPQSTNAPEH